ncbi:MAG: ferric reductase [Acidimicrobiia bacterium]
MVAALNPQFWWYLSRASGIVAWLMLTAAVIWGVVLATGAFPEHRRPAWLRDLHTWLGGLSVLFLAVHLVALVADSYVSFGLVDLLVPFASDWKPGAVALGVLAMWLVVAVQVTSLAMRHLPRRAWRVVHLSSYLAFWATSMHAAFAGTDRTSLLYQVTAVLAIAAVVWSLLYRVTNPKRRRAAGRSVGAT